MNPSVLVFALLACLVIAITVVIWQLLRAQLKTSSAHTDPVSRPVAAPQPEPLPLPADERRGPVKARVTYTKADGSTRDRSLTIFSRNLKDGVTHSLNCRQDGERLTKQFLLSGISLLELPETNPPLRLTTAEDIRAWLEIVVPERSQSPGRQRSTPDATAISAPRPADQSVTPAPLPLSPPPPPPPPAKKTAAPLPSLLPDGARGFAVLDLETTGTGRSCRIVEIALIRLDPQGRITEEWETLVHPGTSIPNAHVHGIDDALVAGAPSFGEIAGILAAKLHDHVLVAHNLRGFDGPILEAHFAEVDGIGLSLGAGVDTMPRPRVKLVELCAQHGVELDPGVAHTALGDTRALTKALQRGMAHLEPASSAVVVEHNGLLGQSAQARTRAMAMSVAIKAPPEWTAISIQLETGQLFVTTGPASTKPDTEIKRAEAHGIQLGLEYRKVNAIPKRNPPAFLLSTSLTLNNRKMADARELQVPVVLCRDFMQAHAGASVRAWTFQPQVEPA